MDPTEPGWILGLVDGIKSSSDRASDATKSGADRPNPPPDFQPTDEEVAWGFVGCALFLVITIVVPIARMVARRRREAKRLSALAPSDEEGGIALAERDERDDSSRSNRGRLRYWRAKLEEKLGRGPPPAAESASESATDSATDSDAGSDTESDAPPAYLAAESDAPPTYPAAVRPARSPRLARPARRDVFSLPSRRPAYIPRPGEVGFGQPAHAHGFVSPRPGYVVLAQPAQAHSSASPTRRHGLGSLPGDQNYAQRRWYPGFALPRPVRPVRPLGNNTFDPAST